MSFPAHFPEILFSTLSLIFSFLLFRAFVVNKTISLSPDFACRLRNDSDPQFSIVFTPKGNKTYYKSEIPRLGNDLLSIRTTIQEFPFKKDEIVNGAVFNGKISIVPGSNSAYTNYFERIIGNESKKTELSFWDMKHSISEALDKPDARTCKAVFFMYLKAELCDSTCFDWEDFDLEDFSFEMN
ncbi:MAG: hypothetical protein V4504_01875 [Patescibacteria group bacterium]